MVEWFKTENAEKLLHAKLSNYPFPTHQPSMCFRTESCWTDAGDLVASLIVEICL